MTNSSDETFLRNKNVFNQGDKPKFMYIVAKGEFELLRNKKAKFALMDPTKVGKMEAQDIDTDHMMKLLKNRT